MKISDPLNQFAQICRQTIEQCSCKVSKTMRRNIAEVLELYMALNSRINFTQMGKIGKHIEQTYRNTFKQDFDWLEFNSILAQQYFASDKRKAIAIDPSYIPKSGKHTDFLDYFWSGAAGQAKWGLEILAIAYLGIDSHDCISLYAQQTPDNVSLERYDSNLIDWYARIIERKKEQLSLLSKYIVADSFFAVNTFVARMTTIGFHVISRLHDNAHLRYILDEKEQHTGKRGAPHKYGNKINISNLDMKVFKKVNLKIDDGELFSAIVYAKAFKRNIKLVVWKNTKGQYKLYFSTDVNMSDVDVIDYYRTRFQIEFRIRDAKQYAGLTHCQARSTDKLGFAFNASFASVNVAKILIQQTGYTIALRDVKYLISSQYLIRRIFSLSGFRPNRAINTKIVKELLDFAANAA
mgnify:FL=1